MITLLTESKLDLACRTKFAPSSMQSRTASCLGTHSITPSPEKSSSSHPCLVSAPLALLCLIVSPHTLPCTLLSLSKFGMMVLNPDGPIKLLLSI